MKRQFVFLKFQNHIEHLWKKSKHKPHYFEKAYLTYLSSDWSIFYRFHFSKIFPIFVWEMDKICWKKITDWLKTHWLSLQEGEKLLECDPPPPIVTCEICLLLAMILVWDIWVVLNWCFALQNLGTFHVLLAVQVVAYWLFWRHYLLF